MLSLLAGSLQAPGAIDAVGTAASFNTPAGVVQGTSGDIFVADTGNHTIRRIAPDGTVSTFAGKAGEAGFVDGAGATARFNQPQRLALGTQGELYVTDRVNCSVRRVSPAGVVSTLAGVPGQCTSVDGNASSARFNFPIGIALDATGNVYVGDSGAVRKIDAAGLVSTTIAGCTGANDAQRACAPNEITGLAFDAAGNLYIAGGGSLEAFVAGGSVRRVDARGAASPWANVIGGVLTLPNVRSVVALPNGDVLAAVGSDGARFASPSSSIRRIDRDGNVTTFAGQAADYQFGYVDGPAGASRLWRPQQLALGVGGRVLVADAGNHAIRQIDTLNNVSTIAGGAGNGYVDATGSAARFSRTVSIAAMTDGTLRVADDTNAVLRTVTPNGVVTTTPIDVRFAPPGDFAPAHVSSVAVSNEGRLYAGRALGNFSDFAEPDVNGRLVTVNTPGAGGGTSTITGGPGGSLYYQAFNGIFRKPPGADAAPLAALGNASVIARMAVEGAATLYYTAFNDNAVHAVDPTGRQFILAGDSEIAGRVDGSPGGARFDRPYALATDPAGNVYVSDLATVRRIGRDGQVTTLLDLAATPIAPVLVTFASPTSAVQGLAWSNGFLYLGLAAQNAIMKYGPLP